MCDREGRRGLGGGGVFGGYSREVRRGTLVPPPLPRYPACSPPSPPSEPSDATSGKGESEGDLAHPLGQPPSA